MISLKDSDPALDIKPPKYREGYDKPLPDYSERLTRRSGCSEAILKGKHQSGKLTDEEALLLGGEGS